MNRRNRGAWRIAACLWLCGLLGALACGPSTADACRTFVSAYEALPCTEDIPVDVDCLMYEYYPCDGSPYFECAMEAQACEEGELRDGLMACASLAACPS